jgi:hypothetical protein
MLHKKKKPKNSLALLRNHQRKIAKCKIRVNVAIKLKMVILSSTFDSGPRNQNVLGLIERDVGDGT